MGNPKSNDDDRRHFSRVLFRGPCELRTDGAVWPCEVLDLSLKGAMLSRPEGWNLPLETNCTLHMALGSEEVTIEMQARVTHDNGDTLGIYCHHIDLDSIAHLKRLMELNLGDPDILHREFAQLRS